MKKKIFYFVLLIFIKYLILGVLLFVFLKWGYPHIKSFLIEELKQARIELKYNKFPRGYTVVDNNRVINYKGDTIYYNWQIHKTK